MIRLTLLLCGGLFLVLLAVGQDKGQVREGLKAPPIFGQAAPQRVPQPAPLPAPKAANPGTASTATRPTPPPGGLTEAVFVPLQPVRVEPVTPAPAPAPVPAPLTVTPVPSAPALDNNWAKVNTRSANVRSGPSTSDAVIGRLSQDEQVLLVVEAYPVDGWSLVRIEGDGIEGYVATRLLQPFDP